MNTIKKISIIALLGAAVFSTGCKKFLDVNTNPNVVYGPQVSLVLPSAQMYVASAVGCNLQINGSIWAQYWTQSPLASQYKILEQYFPSGSNYDNSWGLMYSQALPDLKYVEKTGTATNFKQYIAISKLMQAYMFQVATDAWGDIPFSEAGKGEVADGGITSPRYDAQSSIYDGIIKLINDATVLISNTDPNKPTTDDLVYGGNMSNWLAFANTLKLKVYLRLSEVDSVKAKAGIATLGSAAVFITTTNPAQISFLNAAGAYNPLYAEIVGLSETQNLVASKTAVDYYKNNNDPRVTKFYNATSIAGAIGCQQGNYNTQVSGVNFPSDLVGGLAKKPNNSGAAPVKLISSYESLLLQAEAKARGWITGGGDSLNYAQAVSNNFTSYGLLATDAATYLASAGGVYPNTGTKTAKLKAILTQKWACMNGNQGFEAWTEWRRTGYPDFFTVSTNSLIGQVFPARFFYPNVEVTRNLNFPGQKLITDKVWWDK
jgi:hypothetical protein